MSKDNLEFGDYVKIEQKIYGDDNEMYQYMVIGQLSSNDFQDVPVDANALGRYRHKSCEDIVEVVCDGICHDKIERFRVEDVVYVRSVNAKGD